MEDKGTVLGDPRFLVVERSVRLPDDVCRVANARLPLLQLAETSATVINADVTLQVSTDSGTFAIGSETHEPGL